MSFGLSFMMFCPLVLKLVARRQLRSIGPCMLGKNHCVMQDFGKSRQFRKMISIPSEFMQKRFVFQLSGARIAEEIIWQNLYRTSACVIDFVHENERRMNGIIASAAKRIKLAEDPTNVFMRARLR